MKISYKGVSIRYAGPKDAKLLAKWWNDGSVMAHAGFPYGLGTTAEKVAESLKEDSDTCRRRLILEYENTPIGEMSYRNKGENTAEIGIKICEQQYQNRGIGKIALSLLITMLFDKGYETIILDTNLNNKRAQHVYETLGFIKTGVSYDSWRDQTGALQSAVDYKLTEPDFISFIK